MNKLFSIVLIMMLSLPVSVWAADDVAEEPMTSPVVNRIDEDIEFEKDNQVDYKVPIEKKKIIKKFLVAMGAVVGSSLLIYFGLTAYNRLRENLLGQSNIQSGENSLDTPDNIEDAVRTFLDKTNWS